MWRLETLGEIEKGKEKEANEEDKDEEDVVEEGKEPKTAKNDKKKCGSKRTFELSDENFSEAECQEKCAEDQNCVAISSGAKPSGGKWCHGCKVSLASAFCIRCKFIS